MPGTNGAGSERRRERAERTRRRIVEAGYVRFCGPGGYADTTMAEVAADAGVAVQTVYFSFRNKPGLLQAAWEYAVYGGHQPLPPAQQPMFLAMAQEPDLDRALEFAAEASIALLQRVAPLVSILQSFDHIPEIHTFRRLDLDLKVSGLTRMTELLTTKRPLRIAVSPQDAAIVLITLLTGDNYRLMVKDLGWNEEKWKTWTVAALRSLFEPDS